MNPISEVGIDIADASFEAKKRLGGRTYARRFDNTAAGHRQAICWILKGAQGARVCLEATGVYHLQLALSLARTPGIELMLVNPRGARRFAEAQLIRAKTDKVDADGLLQYLARMPFRAWTPPADEVLALQCLAHRLAQLGKEKKREQARLHAAQRAGSHTRLVQQNLRAHIDYLAQQQQAIEREALALTQRHAALAEDLRLLDTAPGVAERSAVKLLAEIAVLPPHLTASQWVAQAGIDPRPDESGDKTGPRRISKQGNARIRAALFYPAMTAEQHDPHVKAYYQSLIARGKKPLQAQVAVMRKLLHAFWGMLHHREPWDGNKFYRLDAFKTA